MFEKRVIPCLQLVNNSLVKTVNFKNNYRYIGDPLNTCRIFNELEVDEMIILDIRASIEGREPDYNLLARLAGECFMPLAYGGGINRFDQAKKIFSLGYEKVIINTSLYNDLTLLKELSGVFGSQSIVASIDTKKNIFNRYDVFSHSGTKREKKDLFEWIKAIQIFGAGEIMITDIDREGTWKGLNIDLLQKIVKTSRVPIIAHGGAGSKSDIEDAVNIANVSAVAVGSMVVYQEKDMGVLINYPQDYHFNL